MVAAVLVFLLVAGGVVGVYTYAVRLPSRRATKRVELRLREVSQPEDQPETTTVVMRAADGPLPSVDRAVKSTSAGAWLTRLIEQSGVRTSASAILLISTVVAILFGLIATMMLPHPAVILLAAVAGFALPLGWLVRQRSQRLKKFEEQFPEALDLLSRAIRAGHAFQTAMGMVADELPPPVGIEFKKTFERQNFGLPLKDAMNELADRVDILDVRFFVTAVAIQRETGGNLAEILDNLAHVVRERFKIRRQVRVHTAHGRFTGYVLLALPAALAVALSVISPEHGKSLFETPIGRTMIATAIVMQTVGYFWIKQIIKIEV